MLGMHYYSYFKKMIINIIVFLEVACACTVVSYGGELLSLIADMVGSLISSNSFLCLCLYPWQVL